MAILHANELSGGGAPATLEADLCIVGAGPAGLAIAHELAGSRTRVCVLESGSERPSDAARELDELEITGHAPNTDWDVRTRAFGGTSHAWFGRLAPLDRIDLESRDWVPGSGWPIRWEELAEHVPRAARFFGLESDESLEMGYWRDDEAVQRVRDDALDLGAHVIAPAPRPDRSARRELEASEKIDIILGATATKLIGDASDRVVRAVEVVDPAGNPFHVRARAVVLACGGLETPRLLLLSRDHHPNGFANPHDTVGRYYMNHPRNEGVARIHLDPSYSRAGALRGGFDLLPHPQLGTKTQLCFRLPDEVQRRERLVNSCSFVHARLPGGLAELADATHDLEAAWDDRRVDRAALSAGARIAANAPALLRALALRARRRPLPVDHWVVVDQIEQIPDRDSRVCLGKSKDRFGIPRLALHWRIDPGPARSLRALHASIAWRLAALGAGRLESPLLEDPDFVPAWTESSHPIGTTRMALDPRVGVVDRDCRVHGSENLFVAGSSVFPTAGCGPPTLTIVALALRLADHLRTGLDAERFATALGDA